MALKLLAPYHQLKFKLLAPVGMPADFSIQQPEMSNAVATRGPFNPGDPFVEITITRVSQNAEPGYGIVFKGTGYLDKAYYIEIEAFSAPEFSVDEASAALA